MNEQSKTQQEPTMEEILASIRRIISEDGDAGAKPAAAASFSSSEATPPPLTAKPSPVMAPPSPAGESNVLELTKMVNSDGTVVDLRAQQQAVLPQQQQPMSQQMPVGIPEVMPPTKPVPQAPIAAVDMERDFSAPPPSQRMVPMNQEDSLISAQAASAATNALAGLAGAVSSQRTGMPIGDANRTLEDVTKELLRPMLKQWLDTNLPQIVQRIVEREVAKLAGRVDG